MTTTPKHVGRGLTAATAKAKADTIQKLEALITRTRRSRRKEPRKVSVEALQLMLAHVRAHGVLVPVSRAAVAKMTVDERLTAIEARLDAIELITKLLKRITAVDGTNHLMTLCRLGICTSFWLEKEIGEGAGLSVGAVDPFAIYGEVDEVWCRTRPSIAIYGSVCCGNPFGQQNIALVGNACNSGAGNYGLVLSMDVVGRGYKMRVEGIELMGDFGHFYIGNEGANPTLVHPR